MSERLTQIVETLGELRAADRRAVLAKLSSAERAALKALANPPKPKTAEKPTPLVITRAMCSPWLARSLRESLEGGAPQMTEASRDAVRIVIADMSGGTAT